MQCLILAGGVGTRVAEVAGGLPKALIPINGLPFAHHQLTLLKKNDVRDVVYSIGFRGDQIRHYVGDGARWGLSVRYVDEGKDLLGTGGAIRLAADQGLLSERFFVLYGDSYLPIDFQAVWRFAEARKEPVTMTVLKNAGAWDASNVIFKKGRILVYDKQRSEAPAPDFQFIDYGLQVIAREALIAGIPARCRSDLAYWLKALSRSSLLAGFEVQTRFYEIGSVAGIEGLCAYLK